MIFAERASSDLRRFRQGNEVSIIPIDSKMHCVGCQITEDRSLQHAPTTSLRLLSLTLNLPASVSSLFSCEHALQDVKSMTSCFDLSIGRSTGAVQQPASLCLNFPQVRDKLVKLCPVRYCSALRRSNRMMKDKRVKVAALPFG